MAFVIKVKGVGEGYYTGLYTKTKEEAIAYAKSLNEDTKIYDLDTNTEVTD